MAVITISREYGSRGEKIAQLVAKELGYSYFDKEILTEVAREARTTEDKISQFDERDEHGFRAFLKKLFVPDYPHVGHYPYYPGIPVDVSDAFESHREPILDADEVSTFIRHVVENLWERGKVVIVGRGSQGSLANKPDILHLRFIAPIADRSQAVMGDEGLTQSEAVKKIDAVDKQRAHYLRRYYDADWADVNLYDLVINTSAMSTEQMVDVIVAAVRRLEMEGTGAS